MNKAQGTLRTAGAERGLVGNVGRAAAAAAAESCGAFFLFLFFFGPFSSFIDPGSSEVCEEREGLRRSVQRVALKTRKTFIQSLGFTRYRSAFY